MKLIFEKHYYNKTKKCHYYKGNTFTDMEWELYINTQYVNGKTISLNDKHRKMPEVCERWYNQDGGASKIVKRCTGEIVYKADQNGLYFCKSCAREVNRINDKITFSKVKK